MKYLLVLLLVSSSAFGLGGTLIRQEIRGDKKICYYTDGFYIVVSSYSSCPFTD
jgi:hypothetical protein